MQPINAAMAWTAGFILIASPALLQASPPPAADPGAIRRAERDAADQFRLDRRLERSTDEEPSIEGTERDRTDPDDLSDQQIIQVNRFELDRSAILSDADLQSILGPMEGTTVSLRDLFQAIEAINRLYDARGFPAARAVLPPQDVVDGTIQIRLVEARVGELVIEGNQITRESYIRRRIMLESGELLSIRDLESQLVTFNRLNDSVLRARLAPGAEFGTTDVLLDVVEPGAFEMGFFADNARRSTIGRERFGGFIRIPSLTGRNDSLLLTGDFSEGAGSFSSALSTPIGDSDIRFEVGFDYSSIEVISGPLRPLEITGSSMELTFGLLAPVYTTLTEQVSLFGRVKIRESISRFGGVKVQDLDLRVLQVGFNAQSIDNTGVWFTEHRLNFGINDFGGEADYFTYNGSLIRVQRITDRFSLVGRLGWQLSPDDDLPSSEQFQIGGAFTVRGHSEGLLVGNEGYHCSLEGRLALLPPNTGLFRDHDRDQIELFGFIDHGGAFPFKPGGLGIDKDDFLTSAGFGIGVDLLDRINSRVTVAFPFRANRFESSGMNPWIHFSIQIRAF